MLFTAACFTRSNSLGRQVYYTTVLPPVTSCTANFGAVAVAFGEGMFVAAGVALGLSLGVTPAVAEGRWFASLQQGDVRCQLEVRHLCPRRVLA